MRIPSLEPLIGKTITDFCENGYTGPDINHCAHFVSHLIDGEFGYTCKSHTGGRKKGGNLRVHELFSQCPRAGAWPYDGSGECLIFVTRKEHVDLARKQMVNHPRKHVGIWQNGHVYHYSNSRDVVVKQTFDEFKRDFDRAYGGGQGYYFGTAPASALRLRVDLTAASVSAAKRFRIVERDDHYYAAEGNNPEFLLGRKTKYGNRYGVYQRVSEYYGPKYRAGDYEPMFDHWAVLLEVIGANESENHFNLINTYDAAAFTFGFVQLAAHTANDNLILLLRRMLETQEGQEYFPELKVINGRVHRINGDGTEYNLEAAPARLMRYLNPTSQDVEDQELLHVARFIHGANTSKRLRDIQVETSAAITMDKVANRYARWYGLDGQRDTIVALVADIHHQGRATKATVQAALQGPRTEEALMALGEDKYPERVAALRRNVREYKRQGRLGHKRYRAASNSFD